MSQNEGKDFLDFELDDPLDSIQEEGHVQAQSDNDEDVGTGVLVFEGKRFAVGLSWLVGDDSGNNSLALKRARGFGADFFCVRSNVVSQHGFGYLTKGHRINMPALASVVADVFVGEWHGIFVADNGWWYVAVHADNIAPEGDLFFTSEEEAYNYFVERSKGHRWPRSYAPISWNLSDATSEIPLNKIIGEATPPLLKPVTVDAVFSGRANRNMALFAGGFIMALLFLGVLGQQFLPSLIPDRLQVPGPSVNVGDILQTPPQEPVLLAEQETANLNNMQLIVPEVFAQTCLQKLSEISIPLPGWTLMSVRCRSGFAEGTWSQISGLTNMTLPYLENLPRGVTYRTVGNNLIIQTSIDTRLLPSENVPLIDQKQLVDTIEARFNDLGTVEMQENTPAAAQQLLQGIEMMQQTGADSVLQNAPNLTLLTTNDLPFLSVKLLTRSPANLLAPYFNIPGVIIDEIEGSIATGNWQYVVRAVPTPSQRLVDANIQLRLMQQKTR